MINHCRRNDLMLVILTLTVFSIGLLFAAAYSDVTRLRIPNFLPAIIVACFAVAYAIGIVFDTGLFQSFQSHLIAGGGAFIIMTTLFFMNLFGGGDAKLIPAVALWVGIKGLPHFLMIMAIIGGLLALASIALRKTKHGQKIITTLIRYPAFQDGWGGALAKGENVVPYGVAIACGAVAGFRAGGLLP